MVGPSVSQTLPFASFSIADLTLYPSAVINHNHQHDSFSEFWNSFQQITELKSDLGNTKTHLFYNKLTKNWITELNSKQKNDKTSRQKERKIFKIWDYAGFIDLTPKAQSLYTVLKL